MNLKRMTEDDSDDGWSGHVGTNPSGFTMGGDESKGGMLLCEDMIREQVKKGGRFWNCPLARGVEPTQPAQK